VQVQRACLPGSIPPFISLQTSHHSEKYFPVNCALKSQDTSCEQWWGANWNGDMDQIKVCTACLLDPDFKAKYSFWKKNGGV